MFTNAWYCVCCKSWYIQSIEFYIKIMTSGLFKSITILQMLLQTGNYEVLPTEPLHDVKEHIANVLTELPSHLEKDEKIAFQDIIECSFAGKEKLRGCDYRLAAVIVAQYLRGNDQNILQTRADLTIMLNNFDFFLFVDGHLF